MESATLLLVEDHRPLAETVVLYLENAGFVLDFAADGNTAINLASENRYDAMILDVMLPGKTGFEICDHVRNQLQLDTPILMLTARDQLEDKLQGFDQGADDYLVKPFDLPELEARVRALIRRQRGEMDTKALVIDQLSFDPRTLKVTREGKTIRLKPTGYKILRILMRESPNIVTREAMERELWGEMIPDSDTLRSHLYQLRKAIDKPFSYPLIHTLPGTGVKLAVEENAGQ